MVEGAEDKKDILRGKEERGDNFGGSPEANVKHELLSPFEGECSQIEVDNYNIPSLRRRALGVSVKCAAKRSTS